MTEQSLIKGLQRVLLENEELKMLLAESNRFLLHKNDLIEKLGQQIATKDREIEMLRRALKRNGKVQEKENLSD